MGDLIPISDEQAKAVQEGFKLAGQTLETARDFGGYLAKILGTLPEDLVGLLGADWVRMKRVENITDMAVEAFARLEARGVKEPQPVPLSVALPLLKEAADENREELVDLWARLMAAAMDPARSKKTRQTFIIAIKGMDPLDALVFSKLSDPMPSLQGNPAPYFANLLSVNYSEVELSLLRLIEIGCIRDMDAPLQTVVLSINRIALTPLGRELLRILSD